MGSKMLVRSSTFFQTGLGKKNIIDGYALLFDQETLLYPKIYERISPLSLQNADLSDVALLKNHDDSIVYARTTVTGDVASLHTRVDKSGLFFSARLREEDADLVERTKLGLFGGVSFKAEGRSRLDFVDENGDKHYVIEELTKFYDISICVFPAYTQTREELVARKIAGDDGGFIKLQEKMEKLDMVIKGIK